MFQELENVEVERTKNEEAIFCEEHFLKTHSRDEEGRYVVKMPLKNEPNFLGESRDIALKRLNALWTPLIRDPQYLKLYRDFIHEYDQLGHMSLLQRMTTRRLPIICHTMASLDQKGAQQS
ncbi:uncharacterized protein TNCV_3568701 [Trichonephila clavipes]|nr:uncharacterized protein TNCV_3568701 [Trichonephila clavipes]